VADALEGVDVASSDVLTENASRGMQ